MSRLIVKNLPDKVNENRLRDLFSCQGGEITDIKLCFTKKGVFRKFGFVGYSNPKDAESALLFLNKTFMDTNKIEVEVCKDLGDTTVPRPWSKYAKDSSAFQRRTKEVSDRMERIRRLQEGAEKPAKKTDKIKKHVLRELEDVEDDPEFQEFLVAHSNKAKKKTWTNENIAIETKADEKETSNSNNKSVAHREKCRIFEGDSSDDDDNDGDTVNENDGSRAKLEDDTNTVVGDEEGNPAANVEAKMKCSDLDWLKSKVTKTKGETTSSSEQTNEVADNQTERHSSVSDSAGSVDDNTISDVISDVNNKKKKREKKTEIKGDASITNSTDIVSRTVKMRGIPFKCNEEDVLDFFKPLVIEDMRFQKNDERKSTGYAFVDFRTVEDAHTALEKDRACMKGRYVELFLVHNKKDDEKLGEKKWQIELQSAEDAEDVPDTGRLFIRNLSYTCTESDLEALFSKYGPLVEVNLPVDKNSNKSTGFAFVAFMMPEHAVKALSELDGSIFQGRLLHLLPGKVKKTKHSGDLQGSTSSYKQKKEERQKMLSSSSHNWNALFLGQNAVAEVMANRMNTSKHHILESEGTGSVAVRMALGETELVTETREFLESQGVKLDVFGQANSARSKSIMLAKNLPPGTTEIELQEIFSKFGDLGRVLMPPFGITAIVEFLQSKDAKEAFSNLAYSKFKHTPLYLEWAPVDVFTGEVTIKKEQEKEENGDESDESDMESTSGNVLFVKNLNFDTTEDTLKDRFKSCGKLKNVTVAKRKDPKKPNVMLSMGYGFVEYKTSDSADKAIKLLQNCEVDGHKLELKKSHRESIAPKSSRKRTIEKNQVSTKIVVRNIPFEATSKEIQELFSSFGTIKTVRLPKKMAGTGSHRGFAFVDFTTKQEAKRAFKALCQSTHLYGRRLVLEWAEEEDSVELLRQKTAQHYHETGESHTKKKKVEFLSALEKRSAENNDDSD